MISCVTAPGSCFDRTRACGQSRLNEYGLERCRAALVVADANGFVDLRDEDLSVADFAGAGRGEDGLHPFFDPLVDHDHLQLDFGEEVDGVFASPIELRVALLTAMAACLENGHALNSH